MSGNTFNLPRVGDMKTNDQSYKHFTSVHVVIWAISSQYNSRVVNYDCELLYKIDHMSVNLH